MFYEQLNRRKRDTATWIQNLDEAVCISHTFNTHAIGMNKIIPPPTMSK